MRTAAKALILALLALWVYFPCLHGGWLWDDGLEVAQNAAVHAASGWWTPWVHPEGMDYFPLKGTLVWAEWHLWGADTLGYHLSNLALHVAGSLLVWRLLWRLGVRRAFLGGLLFAVHPLCVESVAWISEFKNTASLPLLLASALTFVEADQGGRRFLRPLSLAFFVAALLCKTSVVMLPLVLLAYRLWRGRRLGRADLQAVAPFLAAALALGAVTVWFQSTRAIGASAPAPALASRLAGAGSSVVAYVRHSLWPAGVCPVYAASPGVWAGAASWAATAVALAVFWMKRAGWGWHALLGAAWYLLNLAPVLGIVPMAYTRIAPMADHFAYLPLVGLAGLAAAGASAAECALLRRSRSLARPGYWVAPAFLGAAGLLAWQSHAYAASFRGEKALWTRAVERNPDAWLAHNNLGRVLLEAGDLPGAEEELQRAVRLRPDSPEAHANLGNALAARGDDAQAAREYAAALAIDPGFAGAHYNLGLLYLRTRHPDHAEEEFRKTLRVDPRHAQARNNLGLALAGQGRPREAMAEFEAALALDPSMPEAHLNRGNALFRLDRIEEAAAEYREALRLDPGYAGAHTNLGHALNRLGREAEARAEFEAAARSANH